MNLPNKLTLVRIFMVIPFIILMSLAINAFFATKSYTDLTMDYLLAAGLVFFLAMITDVLDGHFARKNHQITTFGKLFDPLADKFMTTTAFIMLSIINIVPFWLTIIFVLRDIFVDGSRNMAASNNVKVEASIYGKIKTISQTIGILIVLTITPFIYIENNNNFIIPNWKIEMLNIPLYIALIMSIISGYLYFKQITPFINIK